MDDKSSHQHPLIEKSYQEQDAHAWETDYKKQLRSVLGAQGSNLDQLIEVVFKYGILERIAPSNIERIKARKEEKRQLWLQGQNDPKLYWSILYSAAHLVYNAEKDQTVSSGPVAIAYKTLFSKLSSSGKLFQYFPKGEKMGVVVGTKLQTLAKIELNKRDKKQSHELIHIGASGVHKKKKSTVVGYHPEGKIILEVYATAADMLDMNEKLNTTVYPWEINPEEFKTRKMPHYGNIEKE